MSGIYMIPGPDGTIDRTNIKHLAMKKPDDLHPYVSSRNINGKNLFVHYRGDIQDEEKQRLRDQYPSGAPLGKAPRYITGRCCTGDKIFGPDSWWLRLKNVTAHPNDREAKRLLEKEGRKITIEPSRDRISLKPLGYQQSGGGRKRRRTRRKKHRKKKRTRKTKRRKHHRRKHKRKTRRH